MEVYVHRGASPHSRCQLALELGLAELGNGAAALVSRPITFQFPDTWECDCLPLLYLLYPSSVIWRFNHSCYATQFVHRRLYRSNVSNRGSGPH